MKERENERGREEELMGLALEEADQWESAALPEEKRNTGFCDMTVAFCPIRVFAT